MTPAVALRRLEVAALSYGPGCSATKRDLLRSLERRRLTTAREVLRLHETLCFLRAYPDDRELLETVVYRNGRQSHLPDRFLSGIQNNLHEAGLIDLIPGVPRGNPRIQPKKTVLCVPDPRLPAVPLG